MDDPPQDGFLVADELTRGEDRMFKAELELLNLVVEHEVEGHITFVLNDHSESTQKGSESQEIMSLPLKATPKKKNM